MRRQKELFTNVTGCRCRTAKLALYCVASMRMTIVCCPSLRSASTSGVARPTSRSKSVFQPLAPICAHFQQVWEIEGGAHVRTIENAHDEAVTKIVHVKSDKV